MTLTLNQDDIQRIEDTLRQLERRCRTYQLRREQYVFELAGISDSTEVALAKPLLGRWERENPPPVLTLTDLLKPNLDAVDQ